MNNKSEFNKGLCIALRRCEIQYYAQNGGGTPEFFQGLSVDELLTFIQDLGYRVKESNIVDGIRWIVLNNDISVCLDENDPGFCFKNK